MNKRGEAMKYFTPNLWKMLSSLDETKRQNANAQWKEAWEQYQKYMEEEVHNNISKKKWSTIIRCHSFHDSIINGIEIINSFYKQKPSMCVSIILDNKIRLQLINVTHCLFDIHNRVALPCRSFSWGYCEFELIDNKRIRLSIISDVTNQFIFEFDNIAIHKWNTTYPQTSCSPQDRVY